MWLCKWFAQVCQSVRKKLEDTKGAIKIRKSFVDIDGMIDHLCLKFLFKAFVGHCALLIRFTDFDCPFGVHTLQ
jgi:hypothetical protein